MEAEAVILDHIHKTKPFIQAQHNTHLQNERNTKSNNGKKYVGEKTTTATVAVAMTTTTTTLAFRIHNACIVYCICL